MINFSLIISPNSCCERDPSPGTVGNAQLHRSEEPGPNHLPDGGGGEQRERQGERAPDAVDGHQDLPGPQEERQGGSSPVARPERLDHQRY